MLSLKLTPYMLSLKRSFITHFSLPAAVAAREFLHLLQCSEDIFLSRKLLFCHLQAISSLLLPRFAVTCDRKSKI